MSLENTATEPENQIEEEQAEEVVTDVTAEDAPAEESTDGEQATEQPAEPAETPLLRDIRKMLREEKKRARQLEQELQTLKTPKADDSYLGPEPTLEQVDYDAAAYAVKLKDWLGKKSKIEEKERQSREENDRAAKSWQEKLDAYKQAKNELPAEDIEDAEDVVQTLFSATQQGIMLNGLGANAAKVVLELGKNTIKAKALSEIRDPVEFAIAIGELKASMQNGNKRNVPAPEKTVSGGSKSPNSGSKLEDLRAKAEKTGDFTEYLAYKRSMKK